MMEVLKARLSTLPQKISFVIICCSVFIMFFYFIFACVQAQSALTTPTYRIWMKTEQNVAFPQFTVCPEYSEGLIEFIQCWILKKGGNILIPPSSTFVTPDGRACTVFNADGHIQNVARAELWCSANATNTWVATAGNIQFFFAAQGETNYDDICGECVLGQDNYVANWHQDTYISVEKKVFYSNGFTDQRFLTTGYSYPFDQGISNYTRHHDMDILFGFTSLDVWYYQQYNLYNFWQWMGFVGGAAFLFKMIHDGVMGCLYLTVFRGEKAEYNAIT